MSKKSVFKIEPPRGSNMPRAWCLKYPMLLARDYHWDCKQDVLPCFDHALFVEINEYDQWLERERNRKHINAYIEKIGHQPKGSLHKPKKVKHTQYELDFEATQRVSKRTFAETLAKSNYHGWDRDMDNGGDFFRVDRRFPIDDTLESSDINKICDMIANDVEETTKGKYYIAVKRNAFTYVRFSVIFQKAEDRKRYDADSMHTMISLML